MRGKRCILGRHGVLSHSLSINGTQAIAARVASRAATFRHNEMRKEEKNETARAQRTKVKPRQDGERNQRDGSRKGTFEI